MAVESTTSMRSTDPTPASLPPLGAAGLVHTKPLATPQYIPTLTSDYRQDLGEVMLNDGSIGYLQPAAPAAYFACPPVQLARHTSLPVSMMRTTTPIAHFIQQAPPTAEMAAMPPSLGRQRSLGFIMHPQPNMQHYNVPRLVAYPPPLVHVSTPMQSQALNVSTSQSAEQRLQGLPMLPTMTKPMEQGNQASAPGVEPIAFNGRLSEARMSLGEIDSLALAVLSEPSDDKRDDGLRFSVSQKFSNASSVGCAQDLQKALESLDKLMPDVGDNGEAPRFSFPNARGSLPMLISPQLKNPNVSPSACMSMLVIDPNQQQAIKTSPKPIAFCKVAGCGRRVRSKGFCKTHGGGRKCSIEGCKKSSQNGEFCIGHGGGKKCKQEGCAKAAQSHGLCKAHGGGARCKYPNCNKSSQGGGLCRAHGGGKRCQAAGCPKGAQRGNFCATHGGFRNCKIEGCVRTDRGGGFCEVHRRGRLCKVEGCKKLARNQGMCTMHIREERQDGADPMAQLVTPVA